MLFNKKLLMGLSYIIAVLLILTLILNVAIYVWEIFGTAPLQLFDPQQIKLAPMAAYYVFLNKIATLLFFYVMIGGFAALIKGSKLPEGFKK